MSTGLLRWRRAMTRRSSLGTAEANRDHGCSEERSRSGSSYWGQPRRTMTRKRVPVGPFLVDDLDHEGVVRQVTDTWMEAEGEKVVTAFALHVGGLNNRHEQDFVRAMNAADVTYADGISVVMLARLEGGRVGRAATTDVGWDILRAMGQSLGRPARCALIGGYPGLAERAAEVLTAEGAGEIVLCEHGFHRDWKPVLNRLRLAQPDVCVVGLGAPREMLWVERWKHLLPPAVILTSGGWFGHIVGDELRAPVLFQRLGLEWVARLVQAPRRLAPRYLRGAFSLASLCLASLRSKL